MSARPKRPPIARQGVESSCAATVGYCPDRKLLHVEFSSGAVYEYQGVDADAHKALMEADSFGAHFGQHVRLKFPARRLPQKKK